MSARTLTQVAVAVLGVVALGLGAVLVLREANAGKTDDRPAQGSSVCDLSAGPPALSPKSEDVVLLLSGDKGAVFTLDGKAELSVPEEPQRFSAGAHALHAECGDRHAELSLELLPFTPAAVHVGCAPEPTFFVVGATCDECPDTAAARKAALKLGKASGAFAAASAQEKLELQTRTRAYAVLTTRWNVLTERYSRVLNVVGREAPGAVASANQRMEELSAGFKDATASKDAVGQDASIRAAEETLRVFVHAARLARPTDCDFQKRLTESF